ncbi:MAG: hypothetical protein VKJ05_01065 [Synechococcaceae cyanobacterium]|nr:hypothetical protein [Synechococcaceae cyanobacterium]
MTVQDAALFSSPSVGSLGSISISLSGFTGTGAGEIFSDTYFFNPQLTGPQSFIATNTTSFWTATFGSPVKNIGLYTYFWRGLNSGAVPTTYYFSQAPTIISGCSEGTTSGNTLTFSGLGFCTGIIGFSGETTSLSVSSNASSSVSQRLTFASFKNPSPPSVPGQLTILGLGNALAISRRLRKFYRTRQQMH